MGLFDGASDLLKGVLGNVAATAASDLISAALAKTSFGDLQGLVSKLQQGGLGDEVQSWLSNGANLLVTADQLRQVLGNEQIQHLADKFGVSTDTVANFLAEHLPNVVDQASPNGALPPSPET